MFLPGFVCLLRMIRIISRKLFSKMPLNGSIDWQNRTPRGVLLKCMLAPSLAVGSIPGAGPTHSRHLSAHMLSRISETPLVLLIHAPHYRAKLFANFVFPGIKEPLKITIVYPCLFLSAVSRGGIRQFAQLSFPLPVHPASICSASSRDTRRAP